MIPKEASINIDILMKDSEGRENHSMTTVMQNAIIANGIETVAFNNSSRIGLQNNFSHEIKSGKITSQEKSGRCWMFAGLNLFRKSISEKLQLEDFEFSQNYPMFFDKLEKANYFLESILRTLDEDIYSRIVMWLLNDPLQDGGQWDMFVNLIKKYGAVPKSVMPETYHSSNSSMMNQLLTSKLRQWASVLRDEAKKGTNLAKLRGKKQDFMAEFYHLLSFFLGEPPREFSYEYRNKEEKHLMLEKLTPQRFFEEFVTVDLDQYVSLIHAPTPDKPLGKTFTVDFLGNVMEGRPVLYLNTAISQLKACALKQLTDGQPVWFGCDIRMQTDKKKGLMDDKVYLFSNTLGTTFPLDKGYRLLYGESLLTHAMVLTGVNITHDKTTRWKVENSWGEERGEKGYFIMSDTWFDEYTYQVVIHKKYLEPEMEDQLRQEPIQLAPWDPMGSLANLI